MKQVRLSGRDKRLLDGEEGVASQIAMRVLVRVAEVQGATEFIDIKQAHIDGCIYTGDASLRFAEKLALAGGRVVVPTTMNAISIDRNRWRDQGVKEDFAKLANRLALAYEKMGAKPTFTCAPYQLLDAPAFGEDLCWAESNAVVYANSVIGARTNRYGDFMDICAAITGRVPLSGYHLDKERLGTVLVTLPELGEIDPSFFPVLGYLVGSRVGDGVPVIEGLAEKNPSDDDLKALGATMATAGAVGMFHVVGITPEAMTLEDAFGERSPLEHWHVTKEELEEVWRSLSTAQEKEVDHVLFGSPHFSIAECRRLAALVANKKRHSNVDVLITTNKVVYEQVKSEGLVDIIEAFGAKFSTDICLCMLNASIIPSRSRTLMTNSGKFAHYGPGLLGKEIYFGSMADCVETAISGSKSIARPSWVTASNDG